MGKPTLSIKGGCFPFLTRKTLYVKIGYKDEEKQKGGGEKLELLLNRSGKNHCITNINIRLKEGG